MDDPTEHDEGRSLLARALDPAHGPGRLLRLALAAIGVVVSARFTAENLLIPTWGVDLVVPLRAGARWAAGGTPYLASSFAAGPGYDVPYLYPPILLPAFAALAELPIVPVVAVTGVLGLLAAYAACRRLGIPARWTPLVLLWPPFTVAIAGANLQLFLFLAFVWLFWDRPDEGERPMPRRWTTPRPLLADAFAGATIPLVKVSQPHAWVGLLRFRPRAAIAGLGFVLAVATLLLPTIGPDLWFGWLDQLARAANPSWKLAGAELTRALQPPWPFVVLAATALGSLAVPKAAAGPWIALLTLVGAPSLRLYGALMLLPALLVIRREIALVAATLVATCTIVGLWSGIGIVVATLALASRVPLLRERSTAVD